MASLGPRLGDHLEESVLRQAAAVLRDALGAEATCILRLAANDHAFRMAAAAGSKRSIAQLTSGSQFAQAIRQAKRRRAPVVILSLPRRGSPTTSQQRRLLDSVAKLLAANSTQASRERRLHDRARKLRALVEGTAEAIYTVRFTPRFVFEYVSPSIERLTGYPPSVFYRTPTVIDRLVHPEDLPAIHSDDQHPEKARPRAVLRVLSRDGRWVWVSVRRTPILDRRGKVVGFHGRIDDVSDAVAETEQLRAIAESQRHIMQGGRFEVALRAVLRHLRYLLNAKEVLVATDQDDNGDLKVLAADSPGPRPGQRKTIARRDPLIRRALRVDHAITLEPDIASIIPWDDAHAGLLIVRGAASKQIELTRMEASVENFARQITSLVLMMRLFRQRVRKTIDEDRTRIARELHDGIVQSLYAVAMSLQLDTRNSPEPLRGRLLQAAAGIREAIQDIQQYVFDLEPAMLLLRGLDGSLAQLAADFEAGSGITVTLQAEPDAVNALQKVAPHVVQIVREALSNVRRHAEAQHADVILSRSGNGTVLEIRDDGRGFDPGGAQGLGLRNLRNRAQQLKGKLELHSTRGRGSVVRVTVPSAAAAGVAAVAAPARDAAPVGG